MGDNRPDDTAASHEPLGAAPDLGRPRRTPPTIDLEASEVTSAIASAAAGSDAPDAAPVVEPEPVIEMESEPEAVIAANSEPEVAAEPEPERQPAAPRAPSRLPSALLGAVSGAVAAVLVVVAAAYVDWPDSPAPEPTPVASNANTAALDALAARVAAVEARPAPSAATAISAAPDPAIAGRIDALEKSLTAVRSDLAAAKTQSERAATAVNDLKAMPRVAAAPPADLSGINDRLGQIERAAAALKAAMAQQASRPADDKPLRTVVAASLLESTVRQSEPYAAQLAAARPLAADAGTLAPLEAFADAGLPTPAALSRDLLALLPKLTSVPAAAATTGTGLVDRLQAGAVQLLHIERTDAVAGDDRGAIVSRARAAAQRNDIVGARRELATLPTTDRGPVQAWIDKVNARDAALAASRQFAADAMAALGKPAP
ncbi:hypothetical protein BH11PSE4_BH11PSE4_00310 [soil metagenome]